MTRHPISVIFFHVDLPLIPGHLKQLQGTFQQKISIHKAATSPIGRSGCLNRGIFARSSVPEGWLHPNARTSPLVGLALVMARLRLIDLDVTSWPSGIAK